MSDESKQIVGFHDWNPHKKTQEILDQVNEILQEYEDYLPLTVRQIFYRLVGEYGYPKQEKDYNNLLDYVRKARRARMIEFDAIRDDGVSRDRADGYTGLADLEQQLKYWSDDYSLHRQLEQESVLLLMCEAAGMVPMLAQAAHEYGVDVQSSGGYESLTVKYNLARWIVNQDRKVIVLHVGDHDPSGVNMFDALRQDVIAFVRDLCEGVNEDPEFVRIAVTSRQVLEYDLVTAPAKKTDTRAPWFKKKFKKVKNGETVQCEAFPPETLLKIVRDEIEARLDLDILRKLERREKREKRIITKAMDGFSFT